MASNSVALTDADFEDAPLTDADFADAPKSLSGDLQFDPGLLEQFGKGLSMGYLPRIQAAVEPATTALGNLVTGQDVELPPQDTRFKENVARQQAFSQENPKSSLAAEVAGGVASPANLLLGAAAPIAKGAGALKTGIQLAKQGALMGGLQDLGPSSGDLSKDAMRRAESIGVGALAAPAAVGVAKGITGAIAGTKSAVKSGLKKLGANLSGIAEKDLETFARDPEGIQAIIDESSGNIDEAARQFKQNTIAQVRAKRADLGQKIGQSLEGKSGQKPIDIDPIVYELEKSKNRVNATLEPETISQFDELIGKLNGLRGGTDAGKVPVAQVQQVKQFLQDAGSSAYMRGGQLTPAAKQLDQASKRAATVARDIMDRQGPAAIKQSNTQLAKLHEIEDSMSRNLLDPNKSSSHLFAAGEGKNKEVIRQLQELGKLLDMPLLEEAEKLSAARTFSNPSILPVDSTGKSGVRQGLGTLLSSLLGGATLGPAGAVIGPAVASPMVQKAAIRYGKPIANQLGRIPLERVGDIPPELLEQIGLGASGASSRRLRAVEGQ